MEQEPPPEDFSDRFWRCLWELTQRQFKPAERRALEKFLALTYGRGKSDVYLARLDDFALCIKTTRHNLNPVLQRLIGKGVLGHDERAKTWWFQELDLWRVARHDQADPGSAERAAEAESRILADNPLLPDQGELFPPGVTDAEISAQAVQESAAGGLPPGLPAVRFPGQEDLEEGRVKIKHGVLNFSTSEGASRVKSYHGVLKFNTGVSLDARAGSASEPGNQAKIKPGKPGVLRRSENPGEPGRKECRLDADRAALLAELLLFCGDGGRVSCTADQRDQWAGRALYNRRLLERCLREVQVVVREGRESVPNRFGYVKWLWKTWDVPTAAIPEGQAPAPAVRPPDVAAEKMPTEEQDDDDQVHREKDDERAATLRRFRETLGKPK